MLEEVSVVDTIFFSSKVRIIVCFPGDLRLANSVSSSVVSLGSELVLGVSFSV